MLEQGKETDFEIIDTDNYGFTKGESYSHSGLVMSAMRKCHENGSKEMRTGWFNEKTDKNGNVIRTYVEDTRLAFIESVESLVMMIACDFDEEAKEKIEKCLNEIANKKSELIKSIDESWTKLSERDKNILLEKGLAHRIGRLDEPRLESEFIYFQIKIYRKIVSEVSKLVKRLDFYKAEMYEA